MRKPAVEIAVGDRVMPPARELSLWMRRTAKERGLSESALVLTVTEVKEAAPDAKGRWLQFVCEHAPEWYVGPGVYPFRFKARPETLWTMAEPQPTGEEV